MEKGFVRRLYCPLAGALLILGLPPALPLSRQAPGPAWWEARLILAVKGEYVLRGGGAPVSGEYAFRARWEGRLEPDGDDFLLVHLKTEVLEWSLKEISGPAGATTFLTDPDAPRPALRLNYVLKDGRDVEFDFDLEGIPVPLHASPLKVVLELPRSSGRDVDPPGQGYDDFVRRGSNRIALPAADFGRRAPKRAFFWEWQREKWLVGDSRAFLVTQSHAAEAVVALVAH